MTESMENIESLRFPGVPTREEEEKILVARLKKACPDLNDEMVSEWARDAWMAAKGVKE